MNNENDPNNIPQPELPQNQEVGQEPLDIYREIDRALALRQTVQSLLDEQTQLVEELRTAESGKEGTNEKEIRLARVNDILALMSDVNLDFPE